MESQEQIFMINSSNRAINAADDANYGEILKSGDNTLLKYKIFDGDGEILQLEGLPCEAVIKKEDMAVYRTPAEVDAENVVSFKITEVLPSDRNNPYTIEFIITQGQDTLIFPSDDRINLYMYPSSLSADIDIIEQTPESRLNEIVIVAVNDATQEFYDSYNELVDTGVIQENINQKLAESEAEYAPRLTELEQNDAELTAQLAQKAAKQTVETLAQATNYKYETVNTRFENLIVEGGQDSSPEIQDAKQDFIGVQHDLLDQRLVADSKFIIGMNNNTIKLMYDVEGNIAGVQEYGESKKTRVVNVEHNTTPVSGELSNIFDLDNTTAYEWGHADGKWFSVEPDTSGIVDTLVMWGREGTSTIRDFEIRGNNTNLTLPKDKWLFIGSAMLDRTGKYNSWTVPPFKYYRIDVLSNWGSTSVTSSHDTHFLGKGVVSTLAIDYKAKKIESVTKRVGDKITKESFIYSDTYQPDLYYASIDSKNAHLAFNGERGTAAYDESWYVPFANNAWISTYFSTSTLINTLVMWGREGTSTIRDFTVQGSIDGAEWTDLRQGTLLKDGTDQEFELGTLGKFKFYRIVIHSNYGSDYIACHDIKLISNDKELLYINREVIL